MARLLDTTPKQDGFRLPGEFEAKSGCWLGWPERTRDLERWYPTSVRFSTKGDRILIANIESVPAIENLPEICAVPAERLVIVRLGRSPNWPPDADGGDVDGGLARARVLRS